MAKKNNTEELPKAKLNKENLRKTMRLFSYIKPYRGKFILGLIFLFLTAGTALAFPWLMRNMIDASSAEGTKHIDEVALGLLVLFAAQAIFSFFRIYLFSQVTEYSLRQIRQDIYRHMIQLPMSFFTQNRVGDLNSRLSADLSQIQDTLTTTIAEFIRQMILIVGGLIFISILSFQLTLFMLALIPGLIVAAIFFGRYIRKLSKAVQKQIADSNTIVEETLQGIAIVKAFANEFLELIRYRKSINEITKLSITSAKARGLFASFIIFCLFGAVVAVIWRASHLMNEGKLLYGEMLSFVLYTSYVAASLGGIAELYTQIQKAVGATERVFDLLDQEAETLQIDQDHSALQRLNGNVVFENVNFTYPARKDIEVLKNINFEAKAGDKIAIVGPSGTGKSTLASLILRFYEPTSGKIVIDGKRSMDYTLSELRNQMAIVPQDVILFGGTIAENIAYGNHLASEDELWQAAEKANAAEFIKKFPEGMQTIVGERGITLSGGQRQRIAIARAVLKDPAILILDEATSSLDSESERLVQDALEKLMIGRTTFIIAHRLSTIRFADKILVFNRGELVESGTHDELIQMTDGLYKSLKELQLN